MRQIKRKSSGDAKLWSDVHVHGIPKGSKRYLFALLAVVIAFQIGFDWTTHHFDQLASVSTYQTTIDTTCTACLLLFSVSLLGLATCSQSSGAKTQH